MRELMCSIGADPLTDAEFEDFVRFADPDRGGHLELSQFMALPCFAHPGLESEPEQPVKVENVPTPAESPRTAAGTESQS